MSVEILEKNSHPLTEDYGLTDQQDLMATAYGTEFHERNKQLGKLHKKEKEGKASLGDIAVAEADIEELQSGAKEHYEQNQSAYQVQAVKDAAKKGYVTSFGKAAGLTDKNQAKRIHDEVMADIRSLPETKEPARAEK